VETERLQAVLAEKESILQDAQDKLTALESECSALRAAVGKAEAACADLQSRLAAAEVRPVFLNRHPIRGTSPLLVSSGTFSIQVCMLYLGSPWCRAKKVHALCACHLPYQSRPPLSWGSTFRPDHARSTDCVGHWCAQADRAASAAGLEAQVAQLTLDLASKEEYLKNLQAQSSTAAATEAAKASGAPSSVTQGIKELESELATAQETLRAAEEAARQRAEELGRWASAADRAAADQVCYVC
jgi:hypothetical protein